VKRFGRLMGKRSEELSSGPRFVNSWKRTREQRSSERSTVGSDAKKKRWLWGGDFLSLISWKKRRRRECARADSSFNRGIGVTKQLRKRGERFGIIWGREGKSSLLLWRRGGKDG